MKSIAKVLLTQDGRYLAALPDGRAVEWRYYTPTSPYGSWRYADTGLFHGNLPRPGADVPIELEKNP